MVSSVRLSAFFVIALICFTTRSEAQRDYGETCKLRSQIANILRGESGDGCMTSKGLVCFNHKCTCADPSNVYEIPTPDEPSGSGSSSSSTSQIASSLIGFLKGDKDKSQATTTTTAVTPTADSGAAPGTAAAAAGSGGKCVGRAGSPCFTQNSECIKHAKCEGTPRICKCQGIYGSNTSGYCSKTANVVNQVLKRGGSVIGR